MNENNKIIKAPSSFQFVNFIRKDNERKHFWTLWVAWRYWDQGMIPIHSTYLAKIGSLTTNRGKKPITTMETSKGFIKRWNQQHANHGTNWIMHLMFTSLFFITKVLNFTCFHLLIQIYKHIIPNRREDDVKRTILIHVLE